MTDYIVPLLLFAACAVALGKKENCYELMLQGAADGLQLVFHLGPARVCLRCAVSMLRASGAVDARRRVWAPLPAALLWLWVLSSWLTMG